MQEPASRRRAFLELHYILLRLGFLIAFVLAKVFGTLRPLVVATGFGNRTAA
jgi:hypothetical protein